MITPMPLPPITGTEDLPDIENRDLTNPQLFYDAQSIGFDRKNHRSLFEGEVVIIGAGRMIAADKVVVFNKGGSLEASGHVVLLSAKEVFVGDSLRYFWKTGDLKIKNAVLVTQDEERIEQITKQLLGYSAEELYFEAQREARMGYLSAQKEDLLEEHSEKAQFGQRPEKSLVDRYALLLEQQDLLESLPNSALAKLSESRRLSYIKRRKFWEQSAPDTGQSTAMTSYFKIQGEVITRTAGNDYQALEANWTPCRCEDDEDPTWGFRAAKIDAQQGGYVDFTDAVLEIQGIPILYLPKLKVPLKSERQSGFLFPTFRTGDQRLGTVYTQPVYFAFDEDLDATLTTDFFQRKGTRLGLETRYKAKKYSGFELNIETIRDLDWLEKRATREGLISYYEQEDVNYPHCAGDPNPEACIEDTRKNLRLPSNTWRGSQEWEGQFFLSERLSLATKGEMRSDHRYVEDLFLQDEFEAAFTPNLYANSFNTAKGRVSYGHPSYFVGLTSSFGDNVFVADDAYTGLQMPARIDLVSRYVSLTPKDALPFPIYGNLGATSIPIQDRKGTLSTDDAITLGSGRWQRSYANFVAPLKQDGIYTIDAFGSAESRRITHSGPGNNYGRIHSYQSGLTFSIPLDGVSRVPGFLDFDEDDDSQTKGTRYLHHYMDWNLTLSTRPIVVRRGDYGEFQDEKSAPLVYFPSDRKTFIQDDDAASVEESMQTHRRITLSTNHRWKTYKQNWIIERASLKETEEAETQKSFRERAIKELMFSQDRLVKSYHEIYSTPPQDVLTDPLSEPLETTTGSREGKEVPLRILKPSSVDWHINRYRLLDQNPIEPITFSASITYDHEQEKRRKATIERNREIESEQGGDSPDIVPYVNLPEPWTGPTMSLGLTWGGYVFRAAVDYHMYLRTSRSMDLSLSLPRFLETSLTLGYNLQKAPQYIQETDTLVFRNTRTRSLSLSSSLIPYVDTDIQLMRVSVEGEPKDQYETQYGLTYMSHSGCWGLRFLRSKLLNEDERDARYLVQLTIVFLGQSRQQDVSASLVRELRGEEDEI